MKRRINVPLSLRVFPSVQAAMIRRLLGCSFLSLGLFMVGPAVQAQGLTDRLELPARQSKTPSESVIASLASAGTRLIAVGARGHILWSDQGGEGWRQASVPVSSDLTAVQFVDHRQGWAVGHDGVILHSQDGGESWDLQLDGYRVAKLIETLAEGLDPDRQGGLLGDLMFSAEQGVDQSLLALHFSDAQHGIVVGANNLVLQTSDGGQHWTVISHQVENPRGLHLYGVQEAFGSLFIVGEQGFIVKKDAVSSLFKPVTSPYQGSWFGVLGRPESLLVYGLRGNTWITNDGGDTWQQSELDSSLAVTAMSVIAGSELAAVTLGGEVFHSQNGGHSFEHVEVDQRYPFFAVAPSAEDGLVVAGISGVLTVAEKAGGRP